MTKSQTLVTSSGHTRSSAWLVANILLQIIFGDVHITLLHPFDSKQGKVLGKIAHIWVLINVAPYKVGPHIVKVITQHGHFRHPYLWYEVAYSASRHSERLDDCWFRWCRRSCTEWQPSRLFLCCFSFIYTCISFQFWFFRLHSLSCTSVKGFRARDVRYQVSICISKMH